MTKIDIISGFLGAGKTTLIKKLLSESFQGEKVVLIENEFGEIGIDGGFLRDSGIQITEMNSGCICCSLVGDFGTALKEVLDTYAPERIIIEPSGVGKLSDVVAAVERVRDAGAPLELHSFVTVVDAVKCKVYMKNFGEFFNNQVEHASAILLSRTQSVPQEKLDACAAALREKNPKAAILTTPWDQLTGAQIVSAMEGGQSLALELLEEIQREHEDDEEDECCCHEHHHHHHHDHKEGEEHGHGHHHHSHEEGEEGHEHHHHHHDHEEDEDGECCHHDHDHEEHEHHHHHDHEHDHGHGHEHGHEGHHHHHHHHGHDADEVFTAWGRETPRKYTQEQLESILKALSETQDYGIILRAKGMVPDAGGEGWLHFDMTPGETEVRAGGADYTGRLCVIGSELKEEELEKLFLLA